MLIANAFTSAIGGIFSPLVNLMVGVLSFIHHFIPSYGWTFIVMALCVRLALWPLSNIQFKSMAEMQKLQPLLKALQAKHKGDPTRLQTEQMALYKEHGVNPLAGCVPLLVQLPILYALYGAIQSRTKVLGNEHFAWIGSPLADHYPKIFATSLAAPDLALLLLYVFSMYLSVRYGSPPSSDPQQAQTQKIMAFLSPAMIAWFGFQNHWASALILYWLSINVFTMGQQYILFRKYGLVGGPAVPLPPVIEPPSPPKNGRSGPKNGPGNGPKNVTPVAGDTSRRTGGQSSGGAKKRSLKR